MAFDNSSRTLHGALLDSEILADVYLELIGGRQPVFGLSIEPSRAQSAAVEEDWRPRPRPVPLPSRLSQAEADAHQAFIAKMGEKSIWLR